MCARIRPTTSVCSASKRPSSASWRAGSFLRSRPRARSASTPGSVVPDTSASSIARPDLPIMSVATQSSFDPGVLHDLVQPVHLALTVADLALAIARQVAQRADRLGRHQAGPQQPGLEQLAQPLRVLDVGLAAGDLLDMARVDQQAVKVVLEHRPDRLPVDPGRLHRNALDAVRL